MTTHGNTHVGTGFWLTRGLTGGIAGGVAMMMVEMGWAAAMGMSAFMPPRMIAGMALGERALDPSFPLLTAAATGMVVHMVLSMMFGAAFAAAVGAAAMWRSTVPLIAAGALFGLLLWLVNFYLVAPVFGWTWFPEKANPLQQFVAHALGYGMVLGLSLDRAVRDRRRSDVTTA